MKVETPELNMAILKQTHSLLPRDGRLYFLRFIGLLCIILAHTGPPDILMQLRTFDVSLMVIISGAAFALSSKKVPCLDYYKKRIPRLILPPWIFLSVFFLIFYFIELFNSGKYPFDLKVIFESYAFIFGIGYLWIVRVFLLVGFAAPLISIINLKQNNNFVYFGFVLLCYFTYEIMCIIVPVT